METQQSSLLYVIVLFFLAWTLTTKHNSCLLRTEELTNRNVLVMRTKLKILHGREISNPSLSLMFAGFL